MRYDAITLDTNVFRENSYALESGLLGQLSQFNDGSARFVLSDVIHRELKRQLIASTADYRHKLISTVKNVGRSGLLSDESAQTLMNICDTAATSEQVTIRRLARFGETTGVEIVRIDNIDVGALFDQYFSVAPPFEPSGDKRKEFPDAAALMSLEAWAKVQGIKLLAVSKDRGWAAYGRSSSHIDVKDDLAAALSTFQDQHTQAAGFVSALLQATERGDASAFEAEIKDAVSDLVTELDVAAEITSSEEVDYDAVKLEVLNIKLVGHGGEPSVSIVRVGSTRIVFTVLATISFIAKATFTFSGWDDDHGKYDYENADEEREDWFETDLLIDLDTSGIFPEVTRVELVHPPQEVDFGYVESMAHYDARRD